MAADPGRRRPWRLSEPPPPRATPIEARPGIRRVVAPNPSPMTYNGTNSWLVDWEGGTALIDPGSEDRAHQDAILAACRGPLTHILITHTHHDHLDGARLLSRRTGAPVAGFRISADPEFEPDIGLSDGERIGGLTVLHTPGHAMDHLCFARDDGVLFSGDHVMGWSTSVVPPPPYGDLTLFIANLERVRDRGDALMLSAHGPAITDPAGMVQGLIEHRLARERSIAALLAPEPQPLETLLGRAYVNLKPQLLGPARANLLAHLVKLERDGHAARSEAGWRSLAPVDDPAARRDAPPVPAAGSTDQPSAGADLSNWRSPGFIRWGFRNVRAIIASATIEHGPEDPLPVEPHPLEAFRLAAEDGTSLNLRRFLEETCTDGLVVLRDGRIVHEFYDQGMTPRTPHIVMSISKSVVGLLAGILCASGRLDLEARVSDTLPEIAATAYRDASLRHLLDMRAGVVLDEHDLRTYGLATNWSPAAPGERATDLRWFFGGMTSSYRPHGGPFRYVSANTDLLGWAIERATGETIAALLGELLWKPMGAGCDASITLDRVGTARCAGGLCTTTRDLARIGQLMAQGGRCGGRPVVPSAWIEDIAGNGDAEAWRDGEFAASFPGLAMRYRGGWYVVDDRPGMLFAMGIHGQNLFVDRASRLVIAKLSCQAAALDQRAAALTYRAVAEIRRCLTTPRRYPAPPGDQQP